MAIVFPKEPYLKWTRQDDETGIADDVFRSMHEDPHAFLLPEYFDDLEREKMLKHFAPAMFESMLNGWLQDPTAWPKKRNYKMFMEWFDVRICSVVEDLFMTEALEHQG